MRSIHLFLLFSFLSHFLATAQPHHKYPFQIVDSLKIELSTVADSLERKRIFYFLANEYQYYDLEKAKNYYDSAYSPTLLRIDPEFKANYVASKTSLSTEGPTINESIAELEAAIKENKDSSSYAFIKELNNLGALYSQIGEAEKATRLFLMVEKQAKGRFDQLLVKVYTNLSGNYYGVAAYDEALFYGRLAVNEAEKLGIPREQLIAYYNLANAFYMLVMDDSATYYTNKCLPFLNYNKVMDGKVYNLFAALYGEAGNKTQSLMFARKAYETFVEVKSQLGIAQGLLLIGELYRVFKQNDSALHYAHLALDYVKHTEQRDMIMSIHEELAYNYANAKQFEMAFEHAYIHIGMQDTLQSERMKTAMGELTTKYETEKKEAEISRLSQENRIKALELNAYRFKMFSLLAALILLVVAGLGIYIYQQSQQKLAIQNAVIKEQKLGLQAVVDATEAERSRFAKDLHDGIGQMLTAVKHR